MATGLKKTLEFAKKLKASGFLKDYNTIIDKHKVLAWSTNKYPQSGLLTDDMTNETPEVTEALRRLPKDVFQERQFRINRALLASAKKHILPKEEWTKLEDDVHYLRPFIRQVLDEIQEKKDWESGKIQ